VSPTGGSLIGYKRAPICLSSTGGGSTESDLILGLIGGAGATVSAASSCDAGARQPQWAQTVFSAASPRLTVRVRSQLKSLVSESALDLSLG
jgi:hypothetical protein